MEWTEDRIDPDTSSLPWLLYHAWRPGAGTESRQKISDDGRWLKELLDLGGSNVVDELRRNAAASNVNVFAAVRRAARHQQLTDAAADHVARLKLRLGEALTSANQPLLTALGFQDQRLPRVAAILRDAAQLPASQSLVAAVFLGRDNWEQVAGDGGENSQRLKNSMLNLLVTVLGAPEPWFLSPKIPFLLSLPFFVIEV
eukprot:s1454_g11.t1